MAIEVKTMDIKKQVREERNVETAAKKFKLRNWIEDIKGEIRTIHWTTQDELRVYTQIVVGATFAFGMGVYLIDLLINGALSLLTWISQLILG